ncbi:hypothetical protein [Providencia rettgeri]|uniref:phage tail fiber protein n=1 Tax=Providencia rettgeri TaxID=587 RepID=UPI0013738A15|nr:hypothetical protein [Providencia rettgeri]EJF7711498.1 hypothetical protein [Providencia rettgeri]BBU96239.1 hypothetical protein BML2496_21220 [Providencia rettgeri]
MIYEIGTISTKANDPKITGKNTLWKNSVTKVSVGQIILIQSGNTIYQNSIRSVESDTQMTLSFPSPVALTDVKYVISITMIGSVSDGVNKATAMVTESYQFMMILNRLMTESGVIKVVLPDGTEMQLRTEKERDRLLDDKLDPNSVVQTTGSSKAKVMSQEATTIGLNSKLQKGHAGQVNNTNKFSNFMTSNFYQVMIDGSSTLPSDHPKGSGGKPLYGYGLLEVRQLSSAITSQMFINNRGDLAIRQTWNSGESWEIGWSSFYSTANTTKDSNGNLKAASPIIKVFADHIDPNEEAEGVTLKKLHTGIYQLHGVLGLHSDASWGGINGGITIPCGINQLPLVYALYDVLEKGKPHPFDGRIVEPDEDGDIVLYTSYRQHGLPQNIQYERFKLYPEFLRDATEGEESIPGFDGKVELTPGEPCDIPVGHWVDVRVNMPSNSIYNQKQAEAERLAKIEAERLAQEEAKRAVEEAERAEQEAVERKQYGLDDNSVLL